ncbi:MAG TPA: hypothetical protein VM537_32225, partial [Anaerolineae bacterium]|nr:hypothetical protein [Anaerolineae bacterium]
RLQDSTTEGKLVRIKEALALLDLDNSEIVHPAQTVPALGDLTDVSVDAVAEKEILQKVGANWVPGVRPLTEFFNGTALEAYSTTVSSDGSIITHTITPASGTSLTLVLSGVLKSFPAPASVALTAGTDAVPALNYVFIPESTLTLTANTTGWPSEDHQPVATVFCQSAASMAGDVPYKNHSWNDHLGRAIGNGHLSDLNLWIRNQHATWLTGCALSTTDGATALLSVTSGTALQLHVNTVPAFDMAAGDGAHIVNDSVTPYLSTVDLVTDITADSAGATLANKYFKLVFFHIVNSDGMAPTMLINLPSGSYLTEATAEADALDYADFSLGADFRGTGIILATCVYRRAQNGNFTASTPVDYRGSLIAAAGGGAGSSAVSQFSDANFAVYDSADPTRIIKLEAGTVATGTTRTLTSPDADGTLVLEAYAQGLTNKTIDADNNTISNLAHGSEVDNPTSGVHGVTGSVVGTTDTQNLSHKTFIDLLNVSSAGIDFNGNNLKWNTTDWVFEAGNITIADVYHIPYVTKVLNSRGPINLITNYLGDYGSNYNFPSHTWEPDATYNEAGTAGFTNATASSTTFTTEIIPVDASQTYELSMWIKALTGGVSRMYLGLSLYDSDDLAIASNHFMHFPTTETTLAAQLNPGDTTVTLTSDANWLGAHGATGIASYNRAFNLYGYTNGDGHTYADYTYTRIHSGNDAWDDTGTEFTANVMTLSTTTFPSGWDGATYPIGTAIANSSAGSAYKYCTAENELESAAWTEYSGLIGGVDTAGGNELYKFAPGTAGVKLLWLLNRTVGNTTSIFAPYFGEPRIKTAAVSGDMTLQVNGGSVARSIDVQTFASSGTWTKPTGAVNCEVLMWGGGGGGGGGGVGSVTASGNQGAGGGGSGGAFMRLRYLASDLGATEAVTVGTGGAGSAGRFWSEGGGGGDGVTGIAGVASAFNGISCPAGLGGLKGTTSGGAGANEAIEGITYGQLTADIDQAVSGGAGGDSSAGSDGGRHWAGGGSGGGGGSTTGNAGGEGGGIYTATGANRGGEAGTGTAAAALNLGGGGGAGGAGSTDAVAANGAAGGVPGGAGGGGGGAVVVSTEADGGGGGNGAAGQVVVITYF